MTLFLFGLNHNTAPLELREKLSISDQEYHTALADFMTDSGAHNGFILSTCNRTEIFFEADDKDAAKNWLLKYKKFSALESDNDSHFYLYEQLDAVSHLIRVASGLDALVLGEAQILGQLKKALIAAKEVKELSKISDKIFQIVISAAKDIRTQTAIGQNSLSIPYITVKSAEQYFGGLSNKKALLIGAGETIKLCLQYLINSNIDEVFLLNRNIKNAQNITENIKDFGDLNIDNLEKIAEILPNVDIIISATASQDYLINFQAANTNLVKNKNIFIADLAVPRDIDPQVANLENIKLYTVDDLKSQIEQNLEQRQQEILEAEKIIESYVLDFADWVKTLNHLDLLADYRGHIVKHKNEVLEKADQLLAAGASPREAVERSLDLLANKIMHCPTLYIKSCAASGNFTNLKLVKDIYNL